MEGSMSGKGFVSTRLLQAVPAGGAVPAPRSIPSFKPVPFKREKFLSIKTRTAETFFGTRDRLFRRSTAIVEQMSDMRRKENLSSSVSGSGGNVLNGCEGIYIGAPLTPQMTDEINAWNRNLQGLEGMQGFVLTDELVYEAVSRNIRMGAFPHALNWLEKAAREKRLPVPTLVLKDLRMFFDFVLSVLPASNATFSTAVDMLLEETASTMLPEVSTDGSRGGENEDEVTCGEVCENSPIRLASTSPFALHIFRELFAPVWGCLLRLGLLPTVASAQKEWDRLQGNKVSDGVLSGLIERIDFDGCAPSNRESSGTNVGKVPAARQAYMELLLSLAQCAAEAKEVYVLLHLQSTFCALFAEPRDEGRSHPSVSSDDSRLQRWRLRRNVWCNSDDGREYFHRFANDFLSSVYYGRQLYQSEVSLNNCVRHLSSTVPGVQGTEELGDMRNDGRDVGGADDEQRQPNNPDADEDGKSRLFTVEEAVENVLWEVMSHEASLFPDALAYAGLLLRRTVTDTTLPTSATNPRFSRAELEWMQLHSDMCRRSHGGEDVTAELLNLIRPGSTVTRGLALNATCLEDKQCLLGLVVETVITIAGVSRLAGPQRGDLIIKATTQLLLCMREVECQGGQRLMLPQYSVGCVMVSLVPLLRTTLESAFKSLKQTECCEGHIKLSFSRRDVLRIVRGLMPSILEQRVVFGNVYSGVITVLTLAEMWDEVMQVLKHLDQPHVSDGEDGDHQGISSLLVDQRVWAWLFRRARDAGQVEICLFLRSRREKLFY
ncbi:hypothetical protein, conserved [Trypanosoma brucei brucei TREU927]|uniref:Uncharacterized protein n=1 Tax=Trypanosoma brucei brucei (strain 927/4 GUTat10.1) TaxID=185431 RepID=Q383P0_TRYB2|nr:hypothetical protein, conserved [Trypanosoma brucei brucei TREU927]EAN79991.1 hypothetical protein, conserved [Trypanosoma brucei brucei TREU927]